MLCQFIILAGFLWTLFNISSSMILFNFYLVEYFFHKWYKINKTNDFLLTPHRQQKTNWIPWNLCKFSCSCFGHSLLSVCIAHVVKWSPPNLKWSVMNLINAIGIYFHWKFNKCFWFSKQMHNDRRSFEAMEIFCVRGKRSKMQVHLPKLSTLSFTCEFNYCMTFV